MNTEQQNALVEGLEAMAGNAQLMSIVLLMTNEHPNAAKFMQLSVVFCALTSEMANLIKEIPVNDAVAPTAETAVETEEEEINRLRSELF